MIVALVRLPIAIPKHIFDSLAINSNGLKADSLTRVYEYHLDRECTVVRMSEVDFYEDECTKNEAGQFVHDGVIVPAYYVHERPEEEYVVLQNPQLLIDLEKLYSIAPDISGVTIINALVVKDGGK